MKKRLLISLLFCVAIVNAKSEVVVCDSESPSTSVSVQAKSKSGNSLVGRFYRGKAIVDSDGQYAPLNEFVDLYVELRFISSTKLHLKMYQKQKKTETTDVMKRFGGGDLNKTLGDGDFTYVNKNGKIMVGNDCYYLKDNGQKIYWTNPMGMSVFMNRIK